MAPSDPINTLAQWRIWQIELRVLSTIGVGLALAVVLIVALFFGPDAAAVVYGGIFVGCGLVIVASAVMFVKILIFGAKLDDKLFNPENWPKMPFED